ncbi:MAG: S8 family peptidase [Bacteroidia bacterium]|nr:S8 family peptidase [Bacteroidia bacterium]
MLRLIDGNNLKKSDFAALFGTIIMKITLTLLLISLATNVVAQSRYWIWLRDTEERFNTPVALSEKAIQRRKLQNIPLQKDDHPVYQPFITAVASTGAIIRHTCRSIHALSVVATESQLAKITRFPFVAKISPVKTWIRPIISEPQTESLPRISQLDYGLAEVQTQMIALPTFHDAGYTGKNVLIGLFDSGFLNTNTLAAYDSLRSRNGILRVYDFVNQDTTIYDEDWHGTAVLSTIAANHPGQLVGTAKDADFILARTETVASETRLEEDNYLRAAEWADSIGADIVHASLAYNTFDNPADNYTYANLDGDFSVIVRAADWLASKGVIVTNSAGNTGNDVSWNFKICTPCDGDSVLCVGSVDANRLRSSFSAMGPTADGRIKPDVMAMGRNAAYATANGAYSTGNGTSFSGPIIAGMIACLRQAHPTVSNMAIIDAVKRSADRYNNPDTLYGYGIPNVVKADSILRAAASIEYNQTSWNISIFPVPAKEQISFAVMGEQIVPLEYEIRDALGRLIVEKQAAMTNYQQTISVSTLSQGFYWLRFRIDNQEIFKPFWKESF